MKKVTIIADQRNGWNIGFISEYPDNEFIAKTIVYGYEMDDSGEVCKQGNITVVMRNGEQYQFDCMASTVFCGQFGITVSKDGMHIYVISDEVGLWCYTYKGDIEWKTRYTSVGHVIDNGNGTITCIASTGILLLDENGRKIKDRKIVPYHAEKASKNMIYAAISQTKIALIDCQTLNVTWEMPLSCLDIESSHYAVVCAHCLIIKGEKKNGRIVFLQIDLPEDIYSKSQFDPVIGEAHGFSSYVHKLLSL